MDKFFDANNPVMRALSRLVDLAILNIFTVVSALPVITFGASMTAMNNVLFHFVRDDESYIVSMFKKSFKINFKQAIPEGLMAIALVLITATDLWFLHTMDTKIGTIIMIVISIAAAFLLTTFIYMFALQSRYENTVKNTLINAFRLALGNLPRTAVMMIVWIGWILLLRFLNKAAPLVFFLYGYTFPGYICTLLYEPVFTKLESEEE